MRKILILLLIALSTAVNTTQAAPLPDPDSGINWQMSSNPQYEEEAKHEVEANRWSLLVENNLGIYAYDVDSLQLGPLNENGEKLASVTVKTLFTNKELLTNLNKQYAAQLKKKEKVQYCILDMQYNMPLKTYKVRKMDVYSDKGKLLESKSGRNEFIPIPAESFAEMLLEVCVNMEKSSS